MPDEAAENVIENMPGFLDVCHWRRPDERVFDDIGLPPDSSGLRRNELDNLVRERAQWFNSEHEVQKRRDAKEAKLAEAAEKQAKVLADATARHQKKVLAAIAKEERAE